MTVTLELVTVLFVAMVTVPSDPVGDRVPKFRLEVFAIPMGCQIVAAASAVAVPAASALFPKEKSTVMAARAKILCFMTYPFL